MALTLRETGGAAESYTDSDEPVCVDVSVELAKRVRRPQIACVGTLQRSGLDWEAFLLYTSYNQVSRFSQLVDSERRSFARPIQPISDDCLAFVQLVPRGEAVETCCS